VTKQDAGPGGAVGVAARLATCRLGFGVDTDIMTDYTTSSQFGTVATLALIALLAVGVAGAAVSGLAGAQTIDFQVQIENTNTPVSEGDTLAVTVNVSNTGDVEGTQDVTLTIGGSQRDSQQVTLGPGESKEITLEWQTGSGDAGDYTAEVASQDDSATTDVRVNGPANFRVEINSTNSPVTENDTLDVEAIIENTGDQTDSQEITLDVDGQRDSIDLALDPGAKQTRTLEWETDDGDAGSYNAVVASDDDSDSVGVDVEDVPHFEVDIQSTDEPVVEGNTLRVEADVENTDLASDTQDVELEIDGTVRDTEELSLDGGDTGTVVLQWDTDDGDAGDYEANVSSETDTDSTDVEVNEPPTVSFSRDPTRPNRNEAVTFEADATDPDGSIESYQWRIDGETVSSAEAFTYTFTGTGDHDVELTVTDDDGASASASRTVNVNAPPSVSIPAVDATVGEEVSIQADASDDGTISRYEWTVDGEVVSTGETLTYTFTEAGSHQVTVRVTDDDGATSATTATVTVASGATPTPTPTATPTATASPSSEDAPGFGAAIALVAVLATALLARRRV
jgi:PGF-CTERM protein